MHQKDLVRQVWQAAGFYQSSDAKLQQFLKLLDDPNGCWPELIDECRRHYPDYKQKLLDPLVKGGDKLLRLNLIRAVDPAKEDEVEILRAYIKRSDPQTDEVELHAVAVKGVDILSSEIKRKKNLTPRLRAMFDAAPVVREVPGKPKKQAPGGG